MCGTQSEFAAPLRLGYIHDADLSPPGARSRPKAPPSHSTDHVGCTRGLDSPPWGAHSAQRASVAAGHEGWGRADLPRGLQRIRCWRHSVQGMRQAAGTAAAGVKACRRRPATERPVTRPLASRLPTHTPTFSVRSAGPCATDGRPGGRGAAPALPLPVWLHRRGVRQGAGVLEGAAPHSPHRHLCCCRQRHQQQQHQ